MSLSNLTDLVRRSVRMAQPMAQAYAEGNMTVSVLITRPTTRGFDRNTGAMGDGNPVTVYEGLARVYAESGGQVYNLGDEPQFYTTSYVSVPVSAPAPQVDDDVEITDHPDPAMLHRHYRVTGVDSGGLLPAVHRCTIVGAERAPNVVL